MSEKEQGFIPEQAQGEVVFYDSVDEPAEEERAENRTRIIGRINDFLARYPRLTKLGIAIGITFDLGFAAELFALKAPDLKPPTIQERLPNQSRTLTQENKKAMDQLSNEVDVWEVVGALDVQSVANEQEREEVRDLPRNLRINGFEKFDISNETIKAIIDQTLPKGFRRNISSVTYRDYAAPLSERYGMNLRQSSQEAARADSRDKSIQVIQGAKGTGKSWIANELLIHEIFHLQDWQSNSLLTADERIELLKKVVDRVISSDRYKSSYVEGIKNANKHSELTAKSGEYFAEIGAAYMSSKYKMLPKPDRELIDGFIKKIDPSFDRAEALKKRRKLIGEQPPQVIIDTLDQIKTSRIKSTEDMIKEFSGKFREHLKEKNPKMPDSDIDELMRRWAENERKQAIDGAERQLKEQQDFKRKVLAEYEKGEEK